VLTFCDVSSNTWREEKLPRTQKKMEIRGGRGYSGVRSMMSNFAVGKKMTNMSDGKTSMLSAIDLSGKVDSAGSCSRCSEEELEKIWCALIINLVQRKKRSRSGQEKDEKVEKRRSGHGAARGTSVDVVVPAFPAVSHPVPPPF